MTDDARRFAPAASRNREPIREALARVVAPGARVLEIASGSGEHAVHLAPALDVASWQPSDPDPSARASIDAWRAYGDGGGERAGDARILPAIELDVTKPWPAVEVDLVVCVNMVHITPWETTLALLRGARAALAPRGLLYLYGPYKRGGVHNAPSNQAFDDSLRARNPAWGVRDLDDVVAAARGFALEDVVAMPANNWSVFLRATLER